MNLTDRQIGNMRHALGLTRSNKPFRNHYCVDAGNEDDLSWNELVKAGYAKVSPPRDWLPYNIYRVTDEGKAALLRVNTVEVKQ